METLQLKDIAGYLPYGLKGLHVSEVFSQRVEDVVNIHPSNVQSYLFDYELYPLLLPLSSLIEEIEHKGKKIVPIVELAKLAGYPMDNTCELTAGDNGWYEVKSGRVEFLYMTDSYTFHSLVMGDLVATHNQRAMWDFLDEIHLDYRNLIGRGLAKDKRLFNNK